MFPLISAIYFSYGKKLGFKKNLKIKNFELFYVQDQDEIVNCPYDKISYHKMNKVMLELSHIQHADVILNFGDIYNCDYNCYSKIWLNL